MIHIPNFNLLSFTTTLAMFSVERFGVSVPEKTSEDVSTSNKKKNYVDLLLQKSKERLQQKQLKVEVDKKAILIAQSVNFQKAKTREINLNNNNAQTAVKRKHNDAVHELETVEERKRRKAEAKQAKKDRKSKAVIGGVESSSKPAPDRDCEITLNTKSDDRMEEQDEVEDSRQEGGQSATIRSSDLAGNDLSEKNQVRVESFASILQQLNPQFHPVMKKQELPSTPALDLIESTDTQQQQQQQRDNHSEIPAKGSDDPSNHYSLEDSSTSETFVAVSVQDSIHEWGVDEKLANILLEGGITSYFPVQTAVIPLLLQSATRPFIQPRDICVSAPTGSGKTLSYVLPIIQALRPRVVIRLRALVLLPSRELAAQVYRVFCSMSAHTDLMIGLATGQNNLDTERVMLVDRQDGSLVDVLISTPGRLLDHMQSTEGFTLEHCQYLVLDEADRLLGNAYDHWVRTLIRHTGSATSAQSSRNMAMQSFQFQRLKSVDHDNSSLRSSENNETDEKVEGRIEENTLTILNILKNLEDTSQQRLSHKVCQLPTRTSKRFLQRLLFSATLTDNPRKLSLLGIRNPLIIRTSLLPTSVVQSKPEQKGADNMDVFGDNNQNAEATISTSDNSLHSSGYLLPSTLTEAVLVCETAARPLMLIAMMHEAVANRVIANSSQPGSRNEESIRCMHAGLCSGGLGIDTLGTILIFASSVESAHRLCRLLQLYNGQFDNSSVLREINEKNNYSKLLNNDENIIELKELKFGGEVKEMTRLVSAEDRSATMDQARQGRVRVIVSSDQLARGIDLASIKLVINYDPPKHPRTYVHRVGRTARANRVGHSVTILKLGHLGEFKKLRKSIDSRFEAVGRAKVSPEAVADVEARYKRVLQHLTLVLEAETSGLLRPGSF